MKGTLITTNNEGSIGKAKKKRTGYNVQMNNEQK